MNREREWVAELILSFRMLAASGFCSLVQTVAKCFATKNENKWIVGHSLFRSASFWLPVNMTLDSLCFVVVRGGWGGGRHDWSGMAL